ncbi:16S rRNA (guanine(527)-N(7))-methyltransferase RsmG [Falsihalocynthiibacter sp. S25ZX9]|uniref:16S rRNA (guanine(527)-N(7))-methyltransferase RsmG n=1 Tax=Falsihalocynthiibacter sp. S25ZX9 TaxID=3240870 RepID=UPI0035106E62
MDQEGRKNFSQHFDVSRETMDRLDNFVALVEKWNPKINLISKKSVDDIWGRHVLDSAQVLEFGNKSGKWVDIGSGGGFPGIVAAILACDVSPELKFVLVESDQRKAAFLRAAARTADISLEIIAQRVENIPSLEAQTLSARALAPLDKLLEFANLHLAPNGIALFPKGASYRSEVEDARKRWNFELEDISSKTDSDAMILRVGAITNV